MLLGIKKRTKLNLLTTQPKIVIPVNVETASAKVTKTWLVTVNPYGNKPNKLNDKTKRKITATKGKKFNPYEVLTVKKKFVKNI